MQRVLIVDYGGRQSVCVPFDALCPVRFGVPDAEDVDETVTFIYQNAGGKFLLSLLGFDRARGWLRYADGVNLLSSPDHQDLDEVAVDDVVSAHLCRGELTLIITRWPSTSGILIMSPRD